MTKYLIAGQDTLEQMMKVVGLDPPDGLTRVCVTMEVGEAVKVDFSVYGRHRSGELEQETKR